MPIHLPALPSWSATKTTSKQGFDKVYGLVDKLGAPVNRLSNKLGSEAFWPTTLDKESDKAARILRSFCKDGFYVEENDHSYQDGKPKGKQKVIKKIPTEVIKRAKGLAIFTTMRTGLWISGAGGSGILVARKEDGEWSSPSGILLHTAGLGFLVGVDIYDCVVVINTEKALEAFTKIRCTLGGEVSAVAGPVGIGGVLETELHKRQAPVFNYLKSRGFYAGVQIDGTVIIERGDENEKFYGERLKVADILAGRVRHVPYECRTLLATIKAAQGDTIDESALPAAEPTPGDFEVAEDQGSGFGLPPSDDDPDPFGVKALEQEGMEIKEIKDTGAVSRPSSDAFEYRPSPSSPIFANFTSSRRHSKRDSGRLSIANSTASTDRGTQTADALDSPRFIEPPKEERNHSPVKKTTENLAEEVDDGESGHDQKKHEDRPVISKAKLVTIPKRSPPALPPRNPYRTPGLKPGNFEPPLSPLSNEHSIDGLGINLTGPPEDRGNQASGLYISSSQDDALEEKLNEVHLAPRQDPARLSPRKDGFDEISLSGSEYSRGTPAETPMPKENPMHAETPTSAEASTQAETPIKMEDNESSGGLKVKTGKENEGPVKAATHEHDEFHSVPSTPLDAAPSHVEQLKADDKDDFS
ncbi:hypothetical protein ABVK25_003840 [Lepraria finkii]|uniref:Ysc84 actin-binding domain-containing protein n=1 Tax=Lepraria finkii TaxID=1340010 RepID=A0ABR4BI37_9LECA